MEVKDTIVCSFYFLWVCRIAHKCVLQVNFLLLIIATCWVRGEVSTQDEGCDMLAGHVCRT